MDSILKEQIEALQQELISLLPMTAEQQKRLDEKFELEFNYNSNHIEGNTLTYTETKQLLQFDETGGNHTMREYEEMKASEKALEQIKELAIDTERLLNETFIKYLNQVLLVRPYWKEALTPDGQATRRKILVGDYNQQPNSVLLENGKMFEYASPAETPMLMNDLLDWYRSEEEKKELHPVELAALLHYRFVCIHPFDDGNGRISRLLMNYVLYKNNMPPIIIKTDDKSNYRRALHDADSGNIESFVNYVAEQLLWSLALSSKAAKGENLEEDEDWKTKLNVLKKDLGNNDEIIETKSYEVFLKTVHETIFPLLRSVYEKLNDFQDLFMNSFPCIIDEEKEHYYFLDILDDAALRSGCFYLMNCGLTYFHFRKNGTKTFNILIKFHFDFKMPFYKFSIDGNGYLTKLYHQNFTSQEIETISNDCGKILLAKIEQQLNSSTNS